MGQAMTALGDAYDAMPLLGKNSDLTVPELMIEPEAGYQQHRRPGPEILHMDPHSALPVASLAQAVVDRYECHFRSTSRLEFMILSVLIIPERGRRCVVHRDPRRT